MNWAEHAAGVLVYDQPGPVAKALAAMRAEQADLRSAIADVEDHLALVLQGHGLRRVEVDGAVYELRRKTQRKAWKFDALVEDLLKLVPTERRMNANTGEVEDERHTTARVFRECLTISGGKVTGLRSRGLDADEYAETTDLGWGVQETRP